MRSPFPNRDRSPVHCVYFDPTASDSLSQTIVDALATVADTSPAEMAPLSAAVDVGALEQLLGHAVTRQSMTEISFAVDDWDVLVTADGAVQVYESDRELHADEVASPVRSTSERDR